MVMKVMTGLCPCSREQVTDSWSSSIELLVRSSQDLTTVRQQACF